MNNGLYTCVDSGLIQGVGNGGDMGMYSGVQGEVGKYQIPVLDLFPNASIAYSLRKLRSSYTGSCIRVIRASDSTELDIGFVNGILDTNTIIQFCGTSVGSISTWYDQSGNNRNLTIPGVKPVIYQGSTFPTMNRLPAVSFSGSFDHRVSLSFSNNVQAFYVANITTAGGYLYAHNGSGNLMYLACNSISFSLETSTFGRSYQNINAIYHFDCFNRVAYVNGSTEAAIRDTGAVSSSPNFKLMGGDTNGNGSTDWWNVSTSGLLQEVIWYTTLNPYRNQIVQLMNNYYKHFKP